MPNASNYAESHVESVAPLPKEAHSSGVSWGAVIGGAFVAAASYFILLALGAGFGLSAISPWSNAGASASTVDTIAIIWLIFIEIVASAFGGYLTGRLRVKWALIHTDEVYFRDTANGLLAWAVALIISVTFLASAATAMAGHIAQSAIAGESSGMASSAVDPNAYYVDSLFRSDNAPASDSLAPAKTEAARIFGRALREKELPDADRAYLARLVATRTGLSQSDAQKRVADVFTDVKQAEDTTRKATAHFLLWFFLALLAGAFSASFAATIGGRQRDHVKAI